jgi:hypothetical protein
MILYVGRHFDLLLMPNLYSCVFVVVVLRYTLLLESKYLFYAVAIILQVNIWGLHFVQSIKNQC